MRGNPFKQKDPKTGKKIINDLLNKGFTPTPVAEFSSAPQSELSSKGKRKLKKMVKKTHKSIIPVDDITERKIKKAERKSRKAQKKYSKINK